MKRIGFLAFLLCLMSCNEQEPRINAQDIVDEAIETACSGNCDHAKIDFTFRDICYVSRRENGSYSLERIISDSTGVTHDILSNKGFKRFKNDTLITVADSMVTRYAESVNSVHYFAQLPYGLNAAAAKKELLGEAIIKGEKYNMIGVLFSEEGGGVDFDDSFVYWIHKENHTVDYLAYQYATNGGGIRFREAYNPRVIDGIRFVDYNNYKPESLEVSLTDLGKLFEEGKLKLLSKIETESVGVDLL